MKRKVLLIALLALVLAVAVVVVVQAKPGGPYGYGVTLGAADGDAVYVRATRLCPVPCNTHGVGVGYNMHIGHGDTHAECMASTVERAYLTTTYPLAIRWHPAQGHPGVGDDACIFWCCQPIPAMMIFHWEFVTVQ